MSFNEPRIAWLNRRVVTTWVLAVLAAGVLLLPLVSVAVLAWYELSQQTVIIRNAIGKDVILQLPEDLPNPLGPLLPAAGRQAIDNRLVGTLMDARYRASYDAIGFFELQVTVRGQDREISGGLAPWELWRLRVVDKSTSQRPP
ncbi:MAG: hypothetical protein AB1716_02965 [Planctomycetota bacterium]